jgi:tRNA nucleotidyltransferase/poly(A) polymerase
MFSMNSSSSNMLNAARDITRVLQEAGHEALFAGGCVRDRLLGRPIKDIDIATSATPDAIEALFPGQTVAVGKSFGVILVLKDSFTFDVATFRTDGVYVDGRAFRKTGSGC